MKIDHMATIRLEGSGEVKKKDLIDALQTLALPDNAALEFRHWVQTSVDDYYTTITAKWSTEE